MEPDILGPREAADLGHRRDQARQIGHVRQRDHFGLGRRQRKISVQHFLGVLGLVGRVGHLDHDALFLFPAMPVGGVGGMIFPPDDHFVARLERHAAHDIAAALAGIAGERDGAGRCIDLVRETGPQLGGDIHEALAVFLRWICLKLDRRGFFRRAGRLEGGAEIGGVDIDDVSPQSHARADRIAVSRALRDGRLGGGDGGQTCRRLKQVTPRNVRHSSPPLVICVPIGLVLFSGIPRRVPRQSVRQPCRFDNQSPMTFAGLPRFYRRPAAKPQLCKGAYLSAR